MNSGLDIRIYLVQREIPQEKEKTVKINLQK